MNTNEHPPLQSPAKPPLQANPLKGGVDKIGPPEPAKAPFSAENPLVSDPALLPFINDQERLREHLQQGFAPDGSVLGLPEAVGFGGSAAQPARGRPSVFTGTLVEKLWLMLSLGFSRSQAAAYLKIDKSTISRAAARDPELAAELQRAEDMSDLQPELTLLTEARKNWKAAAWFLEFRQRHPRPLTEEDKEEQHQAELADRRRRAELAGVKPQRRRRKVRGK